MIGLLGAFIGLMREFRDDLEPTAKHWTLLSHGRYTHVAGQNADFDVPPNEKPRTGQNLKEANDLYLTSGRMLPSGKPEKVRFQGGTHDESQYTDLVRVDGKPEIPETCDAAGGSDRHIPLDQLKRDSRICVRNTSGRLVLLSIADISRADSTPRATVEIRYWVWG